MLYEWARSDGHDDQTCRLKYLLSQSDVFAHFGSMQKYSSQRQAAKSKGGDDLDEDEREMVEEIGDGDDDGTTELAQTTVLTKQPSIITGGQLRFVISIFREKIAPCLLQPVFTEHTNWKA